MLESLSESAGKDAYQLACDTFYQQRDQLAAEHPNEWVCFDGPEIISFAGSKEAIYALLRGQGKSAEHVMVRRLTGEWADDGPLPNVSEDIHEGH